jgi:hypothetical protein
MHFVERLGQINNADEQMDLVEPLARELLSDSSTRNAEIAEAILRMYERNPKADGFGTFGTLNMVLEEIDPEIVRPLVQASLARQESWPARELMGLFEV